MKTAKQLVKDSKHFCVLPWIHFHAWPNKNVMPCCIADSEMPVSKLKDGESILDMMNSEEYKKMRSAMLNDERYEACARCYELEDNGTWTLRQSQNAVRGIDSIDLIEATNLDGSIDEFKLKYMDIRFSNLCNYKCRSCGPGCSNLWGEEKLKMIDEHVFITRFGEEGQTKAKTLISNNEDGTFMDKLRPYLDDVEECYFAGGEILVQPEHYECMDYWIENGLADKVKLNYTTNMSKISHKNKGVKRDLIELWNNFPNVEIWASIDAIDKQGELIRKGFNWDKVKENMLTIKDKAPHVKVGVTPTVSIWNIFNYCEMFDWMYDNGFISRETPPRVNVLTYPDFASIKILPNDSRLAVIKEMKKYIAKFSSSEDDIHLRNDFKMLIQTLWEGKENKEKLIEFFDNNDEVDMVRDENLIATIPQLNEVYEWTQR
jgi:hypothetical protein|tara:strand:+ start:634 stop:1929 length:1296 start_codon:yes stop_codon:yes gene_type:complete